MSDRRTPAQRGDEEELFERYQPQLRRATRLAIRTTPEIVEDACAFAWMRFVACQPRRETAYAWLKTVARNHALALDRAARERSRTERLIDVNAPVAAPTADVEIALELDHLRDRLMELTPRQREVVLLHAAGWRFRELAERLGVSESRVGHLFDRAAQRMREIDERDELPSSPRGRRLRAIERDPPRYITAALGREPSANPKKGRQNTRREWKRLVLQIEDYREANGITHAQLALGDGERPPPGELIARRIAAYRRERELGLGIER